MGQLNFKANFEDDTKREIVAETGSSSNGKRVRALRHTSHTLASRVLREGRDDGGERENGVDLSDASDIVPYGGSASLEEMWVRLDQNHRNLLSHEEALKTFFCRNFPFLEGELDVNEHIREGLQAAALYSSTVKDGSWTREGLKGELRKTISDTWHRNFEGFLQTRAFTEGRLNVETAMRCMRTLGPDEDREGLGIKEISPEEGLTWWLRFYEASELTLGEGGWHRESNTAAWSTDLIMEELKAKHPEGKGISVQLFEKMPKDVAARMVRPYIDMHLSLIFPDKGKGMSIFTQPDSGIVRRFVQEDFYKDLIELAEEYDIYKDYKDVFDYLVTLRHAIHVADFVLEPSWHRRFAIGGSKEVSERYSLGDVFQRYEEEHGELADLFSIGDKDMIMETLAYRRKLVSKSTGLDVSDVIDEPLVTECEGGNVRAIRIPKGDVDDRLERGLEYYNGEKVIFFGDVLHETEDPFRYLMEYYKALPPGGKLVIVDPTHSEAVDNISPKASYVKDSTEYLGSMMSVEDMNAALGLLTECFGAVIEQADEITPGSYGGSNDTFQRRTVVLSKPRDVIPYQMPNEEVEWESLVVNDSEVFEVWPLSLVSEEERRIILDEMFLFFGQDLAQVELTVDPLKATEGVRKEDIKKIVIRSLYSRRGGNPSDLPGRDFYLNGQELIDAYIDHKSPHHACLDSLLRRTGNDEGLRRQNKYMGEIITIVYLLRDICDIDISDRVRAYPGWENFSMEPPVEKALVVGDGIIEESGDDSDDDGEFDDEDGGGDTDKGFPPLPLQKALIDS